MDISKIGFEFEGKRIMFMEERGKDVSFDRWRVIGYYAPNYAKTIMFDSESEYCQFIESNRASCVSYEQLKSINDKFDLNLKMGIPWSSCNY